MSILRGIVVLKHQTGVEPGIGLSEDISTGKNEEVHL